MGEETALESLFEGTDPFKRAPPSSPEHLPKAPFLIPSCGGRGFNRFGGDTSTVGPRVMSEIRSYGDVMRFSL